MGADSKWFLTSKSIVANLMVSVPLVLAAVGVNVSPDFLGDAKGFVEAAYALTAMGLGVYGRYQAQGSIWTFTRPQ